LGYENQISNIPSLFCFTEIPPAVGQGSEWQRGLRRVPALRAGA